MANASFNLAELNGSNGFVLHGIDGYDGTGFSVSGAGDINGDGFDDIIIGAPYADPNGQERAGLSYIVFGQTEDFSADFDLTNLDGSNGFVINGTNAYDYLGFSVSAAGDVNNDGFDDLIIGAPIAAANEQPNSGSSYVIFGKAGGFSATFDPSTLDGSNGFTINGLDAFDLSGHSVSTAGDINGDGIDDLIIGAPAKYNIYGERAGSSYVIFGQTGGFDANFDLSTLDGSNGFVINGIDGDDQLGYSVSTAGDINNDGFDDLIIAAPPTDPLSNTGSNYVIFGGSSFNASFDLSTIDGSNGFAIAGIEVGHVLNGRLVSAAGDINGDGFDDIIIGAPYADPDGKAIAGSSYVVFGQADGFAPSLDLSALDGSNGFVINGVNTVDLLGFSVSAAGDVNGDGFDDIVVGAPVADANGQEDAGSSYVIFGKAGGFSAIIDPSTLDGNSGFVINGLEELDVSGFSVSAAGDVNSDGVDDLIIGAPKRNPNFYSNERFDVGKSYLVFGNAAPELDLNGSVEGIDLTATFTDSPVPIVDAANLTLSDINDTTLSGATVTITNLFDGAAEVLAADTTGTNITASYDATTGTLSLSGEDTLANYQQILATLTYNNTAEIPDTTERIIEFVVDDGALHSNASITATTTVNFNSSNPSVIVFSGINPYDGTGFSVSGAGDINGDGFDDIIIGAPYADPNGQERAGSSYVVFGRAESFSASFALSTLDGSNGFVINGIDSGEIYQDDSGLTVFPGDLSGHSVSSAGDINGDGFDDLIIGARGADPNGTDAAGESYVVFGKAEGFSATLDLSTLDGSNGFVINGFNVLEASGDSVSAAGDVNGDGIDDVIIGAPSTPFTSDTTSSSYVVFGSNSFNASLDLSALDGSNGFLINGADANLQFGNSVSSAGDVNGDGFDDLIIGAPPDLFSNPNTVGSSYVVFGGSSFNASFDLSALDGSNGFAIGAPDVGNDFGHSVSSAGDINGDGFDDLIIGAPVSPRVTDTFSSGYVVFGRAGGFEANFDLSTLDGSNGFVINGIDERDAFSSVSSAGDVNGDGFDDLIIGAPSASPNGQLFTGSSYVAFGKAGGFSATLDLSTLDGSNGFAIDGFEEFDFSSHSVSAAGDVDGDGIDDLIIGAPELNPNPNFDDPSIPPEFFDVGKSYLVFGNAAPELDLNGSAEGIDLTATFTDSAIPIVDAANLTLTDLNSTTLSEATVTITNLFDGAAEVLAADITGTNITANYDSTTGTLSLSGEDTLTNYQQILETITYNNTAETPDTTDRIIEFVVDDGGYHSNMSAVAITTLAFDTASNGENLTLGQTIASQSNSLPSTPAIELFSSEVPVEPIAGTDVTAIAGGLV